MKSELVGYVRKSNMGNALKIALLKSSLENTIRGQDGTEYVSLIVNLAKIRMIIGDAQEVTSVCQLIEENDSDIKPKELDLTNGATNFNHRIDKATVIYLLQNGLLKPDTIIMCKEYGDDEDWTGITEDDLETIVDDEYRTFEIWMNDKHV